MMVQESICTPRKKLFPFCDGNYVAQVDLKLYVKGEVNSDCLYNILEMAPEMRIRLVVVKG